MSSVASNYSPVALVLSEVVEPGLVRLTLNRPNAFNALSAVSYTHLTLPTNREV